MPGRPCTRAGLCMPVLTCRSSESVGCCGLGPVKAQGRPPSRSRCCRFPGPGRTRNDANLLRTRDGPATVLPVPRPGSDSEFGLPRRPWAFKLAGPLAAGSDHLLSLCRWPNHVVTVDATPAKSESILEQASPVSGPCQCCYRIPMSHLSQAQVSSGYFRNS